MQSSRPIVSLAMSNLALAASLNFKDHQLLWMKISQKKYISEMLGFDGFSGGFARPTSIKKMSLFQFIMELHGAILTSWHK